jgi:hypothetical protein
MHISLYKPLNIRLTNEGYLTVEPPITSSTFASLSVWELALEDLKVQEPSPMLMAPPIGPDKSTDTLVYNLTMKEKWMNSSSSSQTWEKIGLS